MVPAESVTALVVAVVATAVTISAMVTEMTDHLCHQSRHLHLLT